MKVSIAAPNGATLYGQLENESSKSLIVVCYGYKSSPDHPAIDTVCKDLNANGYATYVFRFSSEAVAMDIEGQVSDICAVAEHFQKQFKSIILLASSLGALSAAISAGQTSNISALITLNGFFGLKHLGIRLRYEFIIFKMFAPFPGKYQRIWQFYKQEFKPQNINIPTLVLHCPTDKDVLIAQSYYFYNQLRCQKDFKEIHLIDHGISLAEDAHTIAKEVEVWLRQKKIGAH